VSNRLPWTAFYWDDWDAATAHLNLTEQGAYLALLKHYYRTGKPLPANAEQLHRICRASGQQEQHAVDSVVGQFFTLEADGYRNKRADEELQKSADISLKRSVAALSKGSKSKAIAKQLSTQSQSHTHTQEKRGASPARYTQDDFDERDARELARAEKRVRERAAAAVGSSGGCFTEAEFMTAVCEESGLLPKRVNELREKTKWQVASA